MSATSFRGPTGALTLFKQPTMVLAIVALTIALGYVYYWFDMREGGMSANILTTKQGTPDGYIKFFGAGFYYGAAILDVGLALIGSLLIVLTVANYRARRRASQCAVGTSTSLGFAVATFGCPGCPLPIAGTLGTTFFANSLPLMGLEFKLVSLVVSSVALWWLTRRLGRVELTGEATAWRAPSPA